MSIFAMFLQHPILKIARLPSIIERQYWTTENTKFFEQRMMLKYSQSSFPKCSLNMKHFQHVPGLEEESGAASRNGEANLSFSYPYAKDKDIT
jgi:hypothetical protein